MRIRSWIAWGLLIALALGIGGTIFGFHAAGYRWYIVQTGSMSPTIPAGDLVVDRPPGDPLKPGNVITFRHGNGQELVTHRITDITADGIHTKGDANRSEDVWTVPQEMVVGVVSFHIPRGGYVVAFLSQPAGFGSVIIAIFGLGLLWRLFFPEEREADASAPSTETNEA